MKQLVEIIVFVAWLMGASAAGLTVEWADGPLAVQPDIRHYAVTDALQFAVHDDRIALQFHIPAMPWRMGLMAPVPISLPASLPEVPVADEPTGNLQSSQSEDIMETLQRLNREDGVTIVQVTHSAKQAEYGNRIVELVDGRIADDYRLREEAVRAE